MLQTKMLQAYKNILSQIQQRGMFSLCMPENRPLTDPDKQTEPLKFRLLKALKLLDLLLTKFVLPRKKEPYTFKKQYLHFISSGDDSHVPILHFPIPNPSSSILIVYSHGSGSTLNNVYDLGASMRLKYSVGFVAYDCTGEGQSQKQFTSYESDLKVVLAWALQQGYSLEKIILCGFSIGSYSTLLLEGVMARIVLSPFCGIIPLVQKTNTQYQGELFDNIENASKLNTRVLIIHGKKQMIPLDHSYAILEVLLRNNPLQKIDLFEVDGCSHNTIVNVLVSFNGETIMMDFIHKVFIEALKSEPDKPTLQLRAELNEIGKNLQVKKEKK